MNLQPKMTASAALQSASGGSLTIDALPAALALTIAPFFRGDSGRAATIEVGAVNTVAPDQPATVTNAGTQDAAVLIFSIPRGAKGEAGDLFVSADPINTIATGSDGGIFVAPLVVADLPPLP